MCPEPALQCFIHSGVKVLNYFLLCLTTTFSSYNSHCAFSVLPRIPQPRQKTPEACATASPLSITDIDNQAQVFRWPG